MGTARVHLVDVGVGHDRHFVGGLGIDHRVRGVVLVLVLPARVLLGREDLLPAPGAHGRQLAGVLTQRAVQGVHLEVAHDEEREPDEDDRLLERLEPAGAGEHEQGGGDDADRQGPEDALTERVEVLVAVGHGVGDERCGVDRGDEEDDDEHDRDDGYEERQRVVLEEREQGSRDVAVGDHAVDEAALAVELDVERREPEDPEPDHREAGGHREHTGHELADGAALGDPGDEDSDERRPGDGPRPVEDGPAALPAGVGEGVVPQGELGQVDEVAAERLDRALEEEQGGAGDDDEDQQADGDDDVRVRQHLDALVETERHGDQRDARDDADDDELPAGVLRDAEQLRQTAVDLQGAQADRHGDAEHRADDRDDVDGLADRAVDALAEDGLEDRAHARRQVALVDEVGEAQGRQREDRPGVEREVVEREVHRVDGRGRGAGLDPERRSARRLPEVADRLGDAPEHEDRADAGGEQHREPGEAAVLGRLVVGPELDPPEPADGDEDQEGEEDRDPEDVEPPELREQPVGGGGDRGVERFGEGDRRDDEEDDHPRGAEEDRRRGAQAQGVVQSGQHRARLLESGAGTAEACCDAHPGDGPGPGPRIQGY